MHDVTTVELQDSINQGRVFGTGIRPPRIAYRQSAIKNSLAPKPTPKPSLTLTLALTLN